MIPAVELAKTIRAAQVRRADGGEIRPKNAFEAKPIPHDPAYAYHATSDERLHDIAAEGLKTHKPHEFTDQSVWPDGSREKRSYFHEHPHGTLPFAPEHGKPAIIRVKHRKGMKREAGTRDIVSTAQIPAHEFEYLHENGSWEPLSRKPKAHGGSVTKRGPAGYHILDQHGFVHARHKTEAGAKKAMETLPERKAWLSPSELKMHTVHSATDFTGKNDWDLKKGQG